MRILVVDDDTIILEILEIFLQSIGYEDAHFARSGGEALSQINFSDVPYDCILLDISMPRMTGIEMISHVRKIPGYEFVPIIMLSALSDRHHIAQAFVAGAWDYITKPFEMFELETRIHGAELRNAEMSQLVRGSRTPAAPVEDAFKRHCALHRPEDNPEKVETGLVNGDVFENFLQRIARPTRNSLAVVMMKIENLSDITRTLRREEAERYLVHLSQHLADEMADLNGIVSYQGDGVFLGLSHSTFDAEEAPLIAAFERGALKTDTSFFPASQHRTIFRLGQVRYRDLPHDAEPLYMLQAAFKDMDEAADTHVRTTRTPH